jgi:hypothetical protein
LIAGSAGFVYKAGMTDAEIRETWLTCYPTWRDDRESAQIIRQLCALITERVKHSTILGTTERQIMDICHEIRIPKFEFEEVRQKSL